ncbi:LysR family transcriptional regulator [Polyangium aurulentum]|uniref:LysR family transcriptional regulator n=1 Tax=Polyangium aurulentum TaxID=2567896 RepID=UPI00146E35F1|nr:LysR family transcriptional regulator [Polyangium aurulentum]UQA59858.1 LysR family transcriptional regulator [Polyangium aurulentum]
MDRLRALAWYCKVVESRGISEAARALGVSKAVVSKYVTALEEELNARLLHRTTRAVRPTATGRAVYERARTVLEDMRSLEAAARAERAEPAGTLRVTAPVAFGLTGFGELVAAFARAHPAVRVEIALTDRYVRLADEGFDVAIRIAKRLDDEDVLAVRLATTRMLVCAAPAYLARAGRPRAPQDLADHACIAYAPAGTSGRVAWHVAGPSGDERVWIEPVLRADSSVLLRDATRAGLGIAVLLSFVVEPDLRSGALVELFAGAEERTVFAVYPAPLHASAKVRAFVRALQQSHQAGPPDRTA